MKQYIKNGITGLLQKVHESYEKRRLQSQAKSLFEKVRCGLDPENEEGISARKAADMYWLSVYLAEKSGNQKLATKLKDEAVIYQGYDPLRSEMPQIRELAYVKKKRGEINTLEEMAESRMKLDLTERALDYHLQAMELAKDIQDQKLLETLKARFEKASKEM